MVSWNALVVAAVALQGCLAVPRPDEYKIPEVGNNRRSQYYVLHDDGSYKYGFDTGDNAFESKKVKVGGQEKGKFGYKNPDGEDVKVEYTSGTGGFVARGSHIPEVHPDVANAFAEARARGPYVDPLAGVDSDKSYNFGFNGEEYQRNEVANDDGTVTGSYSYTDEFGKTRSYTYRAGKGIGFEIVGDDIPVQGPPLPSHTRASAAPSRHTSTRTATRTTHTSRAHTSQHGSTRSNTNRAVSNVQYKNKVTKPSQTYFTPTRSTSQTSSSKFSHGQSQGSNRFASTGSSNNRKFEAANTRASISPSGSYSLAYETSSHTRQETGDDNNKVRGGFTFEAEDTGDHHELTYEAGSDSGFVASGAHLPIGPSVPGAVSGQVTGRLEKQPHFEDPLARDVDGSFEFAFEGDEYSRSEVANDDGTVTGQYSVLGEDNILRTYRYRAGKGIGFELTEVSAVPSTRRTSTSSASSSQSSTRSSGHSSTSSVNRGTHSNANHRSHGSSSSFTSTKTTQGNQASRASFGSTSHHKTSTKHNARGGNQKFDGFTLRQYDATEGRGKYGYVLKYDN